LGGYFSKTGKLSAHVFFLGIKNLKEPYSLSLTNNDDVYSFILFNLFSLPFEIASNIRNEDLQKEKEKKDKKKEKRNRGLYRFLKVPPNTDIHL
jgi:hypothetical protein